MYPDCDVWDENAASCGRDSDRGEEDMHDG